MSLRDITKRVRSSLGLRQDEFAVRLGVASSSVGNWETGAKRPSPKTLRKMADLAPDFAREIQSLVGDYEWHPTKTENVPAKNPVELLSGALRSAIAGQAEREGKVLADYYKDLIVSGWQSKYESLRESARSPAAPRVRKKAS